MGIDTSGGFSEDLEDVFATRPEDPEMRESVNAWIWDDAAELGLPRVGVEAVADQWETHDVQVNIAFADGRVFNIFGAGPVHDPFGTRTRPHILGAGPLSFEVLEPYRHLRLRVEGEAVATSVTAQMDGALPGQGVPSTPVEMEIDLYPAVPPFMNGALLDDARRVLETQDEGGLMGHPWRFEQLCRARGTVQLGAERRTIQGGANRIRRQSIRRLATLRGHAWQAALFPGGRGFGYIAYPPRSDGKDTYNEGYVFEGDGDLVPARVVQAPWLRGLTAKGDDVTCVLETEHGTVTIHGETALSTFMIMPAEVGGGGMQLQQAIVRYAWDGEESVGMLERSTVAASLS
jgi:prepilin-type processing-associated H-X9-DG protein